MTSIARDGGRSAVIIAVGATVAAGVPVYLIGAFFTQINEDIGIPEWALGVVVATFWTVAALASAPSGRLTARIGSRRVIVLTIVVAAIGLAGGGLVTPSWQWFLLWAAIGGVANALCHPSTNHLIGLRVAPAKRALAFGIKQSSVPLASFSAGLAIPLIALTVGWRWGYLVGVLGALVVFLMLVAFGPRRLPKGAVRTVSSAPLSRPQRSYFLLLACVTALGAGGAACAGTFGVVGSIEHGMHPAAAGLLFGAASVGGAIVRIVVGAMERGGGRTLPVIVSMLACGLVGALLMALTGGWAFGLGLVLLLGLGWGWAGLTHFVVATVAGPATPAATGLVQTGSYLGCAVFPVIGGVILARYGSTPIWCMCIGLFAVSTSLAVVLLRRGVPALPVADAPEAARPAPSDPACQRR